MTSPPGAGHLGVVAMRSHRSTGRIVGEASAEEQTLLTPVPRRMLARLQGLKIIYAGLEPRVVLGARPRRIGRATRHDRLLGRAVMSRAAESRLATSFGRLREHLAYLGLTTAARRLAERPRNRAVGGDRKCEERQLCGRGALWQPMIAESDAILAL
jgi:hypothetical protein